MYTEGANGYSMDSVHPDYAFSTHPNCSESTLQPEQYLSQLPQQEVSDTAELQPEELEEVRQIQAEMSAADPNAPVGSNKNPIRIIQQGNRYITTQDVSYDHLQQIIQVLNNRALVNGSDKDTTPAKSRVCAIFNRFINKRIVFRVTRAKRRRPVSSESDNTVQQKQQLQKAADFSEVQSQFGLVSTTAEFGDRTRRRGAKRGPRKRKVSEDEDPDFEPDLPEEEILPFPILRKKTDICRVSKPPKHLIRDYKHLRLEDLTSKETPEAEEENNAGASDGGYSDYINADFSDGETEDGHQGHTYDCIPCKKSFYSRAGLARHKTLKHNPNGSKPIGPWSNPYLAAVRWRNKLKEALEKATNEDLIELAAPKLANAMSLWDYMLHRCESGDPPLPHVPKLIIEYLSLVERMQDFLADQLEACASKISSYTSSSEVETTDEEEQVLLGRPAPASVKRRRKELLRRQKDHRKDLTASLAQPSPIMTSEQKLSAAVVACSEPCHFHETPAETEATKNVGHTLYPPPSTSTAPSGVPTAPDVSIKPSVAQSTLSSMDMGDSIALDCSSSLSALRPDVNSSIMNSELSHLADKNNKKGKRTDDDEEEPVGEGFVQIRTSEEAKAVGLPIGRYKICEPLCEEYLPRRYRTILAAKFADAPLVTGVSETENTNGRPFQAPTPRVQKRAVVAVNGNGVEDYPVETQDTPISTDNQISSGGGENSEQDGLVQTFYWGGTMFSMSGEGLGYPVPEDWISSGAFLSVLSESGESSEMAMEVVSGRLFHRPTGQLVTMTNDDANLDAHQPLMGWSHADGQQQLQQNEHVSASLDAFDSSICAPDPPQDCSASHELADLSSLLPGVTISEISPGVCLVVKPNGVQFQVEHGGEGITLETLQTILQMED